MHGPTYHQPWRSAAVREEEAAAAALVIPAAASVAAAPAAPAPTEATEAGTENIKEDAAHLRAPAAETLPPSSHGPTVPSSEVLILLHAHAVVTQLLICCMLVRMLQEYTTSIHRCKAAQNAP